MTEIEPDIQLEVARVSRLISVRLSTSESLAAHIVAFRTLNFDKEIALACMEELGNRRALGEDFDYETYIEEKVKEMPKMKGLNILGISDKMIFAQKFFKEKK